MIGQVGVAHVRSRSVHALIACIALAFVRVKITTQLGVSVITSDVCHSPCCLRGENRNLEADRRRRRLEVSVV